MKILITGASGIVGSELTKELIEHTDIPLVICSHKQNFSLKKANRTNIEIVPLDLRDKLAVEDVLQKYKPTHLIHLAWEGIARSKVGDKSNSLENQNWEWLTLTSNLIEQFAKNGGEKFISFGTIHEYHPTLANRKEDDKLGNIYPYPQAKLAVLETLKTAQVCFGLKYLWLRISYMYSASPKSETNILLQALKAIKERQGFETWINPDTEFDFISVKEVAQIVRILVLKEAQGVFNVGSGISTNVVNLIHQLFEKENLPELLHHNQPYRPKERVVTDISKLKQEIGDFTFNDVSQVLTSKDYGE